MQLGIKCDTPREEQEQGTKFLNNKLMMKPLVVFLSGILLLCSMVILCGLAEGETQGSNIAPTVSIESPTDGENVTGPRCRARHSTGDEG